jgi:hypothetical protein
LLLALAAVAVHYLVTVPARAAVGQAADEQRRLREERRDLLRRLAPLDRREAARARALEALAAVPLPAGAEAQVLRRTVLARLAEQPLHAVRVAVRPGRGATAGSVSLACEGDLDAVLRSVSELVRPGSGLVLARARLAATPAGVSLDLDVHGVRARP